MYGILLRRVFFVAAVVYSRSWDFFYIADVNNFSSVEYIMLIFPNIYFKTVFEWLILVLASLTL